IETEFEKFFVLLFNSSSFLSFFVSILALFFTKNLFSLIILPLLFLVSFLLTLVTLNLIADKKARFSEEVLPDLLQLMASNIRAGLTPDKALALSARPEFGILEKEIRNVASKSIAGKPFEEALLELTKKIKSRLIERTVNLIIEGIKKGGEIAKLLEQTANDIRDLKTMKKEISSQVGMYVIFIFIATGIVSPMLFSFSTHLIDTLQTISKEVKIEGGVTAFAQFKFLRFGTATISVDFVKIYALSTSLITSFFSSLIIGLLKEGREKAGIKYIPILAILNVSIFFTSQYVISFVSKVFL
ncbi:MAG: type II secretion system F family protein, partial [Candidatus Aenigmarchaeota archaeon]|nr:type II secretion system F family protein [Candidatus Aenigmarchaeota archaeon]MDW8149483.1 type II secretion system F family protein [Candidatus Aenigmarchaeota archaeon]